MPTITKHTPGSFCWVELMTSDQSAAKNFYAKLFGWTFDDSPMGDGTFYTMLKLKGQSVGALYQRKQEMQNIPPHWGSYIAVDNVDEAAKKVVQAGGKTLMPPFDVFDVGRMTTATDPAGAAFSLWQAKKHTGAGIVGEAGAMCWFDLGTNNEKAVGKFYAQLFGWELKAIPVTPPYTVFSNHGTDIGGMYLLTDEMKNVPPHWLPYFMVNDCDGSVKQASAMGGRAVVPPMDISVGRFAYVQDPQGAMFAVFTPKP